MTKRRNVPALVANMRRAEQAGKTKKDLIEEYCKSWQREAEESIQDAHDIALALTADDDCDICADGWELTRWGDLIPCRFCTDEERRG